MNSEHWDDQRVEQNDWGFCDRPVSFSTEGLGPCIGVCIAWEKCAAIVHSAQISLDEKDEIAQMIAKMRSVIPKSALATVQPVLCGGDTFDDLEFQDDGNILKCRKRITKILKEAGFGKPCIRWNKQGETVDLVADLHQGIVSIFEHHSDHKLISWRISGELNRLTNTEVKRGRQANGRTVRSNRPR